MWVLHDLIFDADYLDIVTSEGLFLYECIIFVKSLAGGPNVLCFEVNDSNGLTVVLQGPAHEVYTVESYIVDNGFDLTNFPAIYLSNNPIYTDGRWCFVDEGQLS